VFGTEALWDAWRCIETLIKSHCPPGGSRHCPIGFVPVPTAAAQTALEAVTERWNVEGARALDILNKMCAAAGDLAWHVDWSADGDYGYALPRIRIWSRDYDDRDTGWQTSHDVAGWVADPDNSEARDSRVEISVGHRITDVIVVGEPIKVMFSVRFDQGAVVLPEYWLGWTAADETAWAALTGEDAAEALKYEHVYRRFYMHFDQLEGPASTWQVFVRPTLRDFFTTEGDKLPAATVGRSYPHPRELLPRILTRPGYVYTSQGLGALSISKAGAAGESELSPIPCWHVPPSLNPTEGGKAVVTPIPGVRPLRNEPGFMLPRSIRTLEGDSLDLSQTVDSAPLWQQLVLTVAIETDERLTWTASKEYPYEDGSGQTDEQRQAVIIEVPGAEWWAALPDTVISYDAAGAATTVYGVIRNDLPVLMAAGRALLARHSRRLRHADLPLKTVDVTKGLGHFIDQYGPYLLRNPILTLRHNLGIGQIGTEVITGKAWAGGGL
ncbi:MAG TPA: hypothetical protein VMY35_04940, partial [Phycisphaerae bacterium]|nr:hypothetical protein [Phycisphaerae bacterium]